MTVVVNNKFNFFKKLTFFLTLFFFITIFLANLANSQSSEINKSEINKPNIFVYFQREMIRESDNFKAEIIIENNSEYRLNNVIINFKKPDFLNVSKLNQKVMVNH